MNVVDDWENLPRWQQDMKQVQNLVTGSAESHAATQASQRLIAVMGALRQASATSQPFIRELMALKQVAGRDELIRTAIATIDERAVESGILTTGQLVDRFNSVSDEIRKVSLIRDDQEADTLTLASSWALSKLFFQKKGYQGGQDVESRLARIRAHLDEGDLDGATREVNQFKSVAKTLASDWLELARRRLEIEQAVNVRQHVDANETNK